MLNWSPAELAKAANFLAAAGNGSFRAWIRTGGEI